MGKGFELNNENNNDNLHKERVGFELSDESDVNDLHMHREMIQNGMKIMMLTSTYRKNLELNDECDVDELH